MLDERAGSAASGNSRTRIRVGVRIRVGIRVRIWVRVRVRIDATHLRLDPTDELRDFGEDSRNSGTFSGTERHDADHSTAASQWTARVTHASGPSSWLSEGDSAGRLVSSPCTLRFGLGPDLAADLLQLISQLFRVSPDETPSRKSASLSTVVCSRRWQGSKANIGAARCWSGQLNEGDVVLKLLRAVELRMDVDGGDRKIGFAAVIRLQMPFTDTDLVSGRVP